MTPPFNLHALELGWSLLQGVAIGLTVLYTWLTTRQKANSQSIETLKTSLHKETTSLDKRLIGVEKDLQRIPTHNDLAKVHDRINATNENVKHVQGQLGEISHTVGLIHEHLMHGGNRK